jgi:signal transduction histidine kinase
VPNPKEPELTVLIFGSVLVTLLLAISIVIFFVIYQKRLLNEQQRRQKLQDEYQRQLLTSSIDVQEKERIRIGQDLHDEIGSSLSAIKMLANQLPENDEESRQLVWEIKNGLSNTIGDVRNIANNLFPSVLSKFGLADALQYLVSVLSAGNTVAIDLVTDKAFALSFECELAIYRIIQELTNNALKHANAKNLAISLSQSENRLFLTVKDDGRGFDASTAMDLTQAGIGIKSIQARIAILQAGMKITSEKNRGTLIEINIPR